MTHGRVLITGAAGFIGSHLADRYLDAGCAVYGVDDLTTGDWANFPVKDANYLEADIADRHEFYRACNVFRPDLIFHCAASYSDPMKWHRDAETNVLGSINAAIAAQYHEAKLVYFNTALPPISSYAVSKIAGQHYVELSAPSALVCRLANVYGPRNLSGPIPTFYRRLTAGEPCTVTRTFRELVYIDDLLEAVGLFVAQDAAGTIDVCSGEPVTIRELYDAVAEVLGLEVVPDEVERGIDDVASMVLDPGPAAGRGWSSATSLHDGVRQTIEWYHANGVAQTFTHLRGQ